MNTEKINSGELYTVDASKINGDVLNADEWNAVSDAAKLSHEKINSIIDDLSDVATGVAGITNAANDMADVLDTITVRSNGDALITSSRNIILRSGAETNSIALKTGNDTIVSFAKNNSTIRSDQYTFSNDAEWVGVDANGYAQNPSGITTHDILNAADLIKEEGGAAVIDLFNNNDTKISNRTIRTGGRYQMTYLTPSQATSDGNIIPETFFTDPVYSSVIFKGISQFVVNNVTNGYTSDLTDLANGLTISAVPNAGDDRIVFAITSATTGEMDDTNTKVVVLLKIDVKEATIGDIVTLVNYFKTGAGQQNGPWAE